MERVPEWGFKRKNPEVRDRPSGEEEEIGPMSQEWWPRFVGKCLYLKIWINGIGVPALLDTGSQVTTIEIEKFLQHWDSREIVTPPTTWLQLLASNGQRIPYNGYWEADFEIGEAKLSRQGCLVTTEKNVHLPPVILGMNVLRNCPDERIKTLRMEMQAAAPQERQTLQQTVRLLEGQKRFANARGEVGKAWITDRQPILLLPNSEQVVWCKAKMGLGGQDYEAIIESCDVDGCQPFAIARTLAKVQHGKVAVRVMNPHNHPVRLTKRCPVAKLTLVNFQDIMEELVATALQGAVSQVSVVNADTRQWWEEIQIGDSDTPVEKRDGVLQIVRRNAKAFSQHPADFGTAESVYHHISTGTSPPIKERHRPLPPAMYQPVREMLTEMKDAGVIRESHSPWAAPLVLVKKKDGSL